MIDVLSSIPLRMKKAKEKGKKGQVGKKEKKDQVKSGPILLGARVCVLSPLHWPIHRAKGTTVAQRYLLSVFFALKVISRAKGQEVCVLEMFMKVQAGNATGSAQIIIRSFD